jgi:hypothetical protein
MREIASGLLNAVRMARLLTVLMSAFHPLRTLRIAPRLQAHP